MTCSEVREALSAREPGDPLPDHLDSCPDCRKEAARLDRLDALARQAVASFEGLPLAPPSLRHPYRWAAAAALLLGAGGFLLIRRPPAAASPLAASGTASPPVVAPVSDLSGRCVEFGGGSTLEVAPLGEARLSPPSAASPWRLSLRSGACWLDVEASGGMEAAVDAPGGWSVRVDPGSQVEVHVAERPAPAALLLRDAEAAETPPECLLSVLSGRARAGDLLIPAGTRARFREGLAPALLPLSEADRAGIEAWRVRRIERAAVPAAGGDALLSAPPGEARYLPLDAGQGRAAFNAELRHVTGHLLLRFPSGQGGAEVTLGELPAWRDGRWHRLAAAWGRSGIEVFLDGRRLLRAPAPTPDPKGGSPSAALGIQGGNMEVRGVSIEKGGA